VQTNVGTLLIVAGVILAAILLLTFIWPSKPEDNEQPVKK